jgi:hypothetical protein
MFFLNKHKNNQKHHKQNNQQDKMAQNIVHTCIRMQEKASKFLQAKSELLPIKAKRFAVIVLCLISFGSCISVIIKSFDSHHYNSHVITAIRVPTQNVQNYKQPSISEEEFGKIQKFKSYIDSLGRIKSGKRVFDSIMAKRPGLMDSLSVVENLYQLQSSNK